MSDTLNAAPQAAPQQQAISAEPSVEPKASFDPQALMDYEIEAKIDGNVEKVKLKKLVSDYQKFMASEKRLKEASEYKNEYETKAQKLKSIIQMMKQNPQATRAFLEQIYGDESAIRQFAEDYLWEQIQREKMSPEQRELEKARKQIEQFEREKRQKEQKEAEIAESQRVNSYIRYYDKMFSEALAKYDLPKTPETIERMSRYMQSALRSGYEPTVDELVEMLESSYEKEISSIFGKMKPEKMAKLLGTSVEKLREFQLSQLKNPYANNQAKQFRSESSNPNKKDLSIEEARKIWRQRAGLE